MAYPLAARFRTGTTLAMFTLVVFTLVTGTASNGSFVHAIGVDDFGGGFQVRAGTTGTNPIDDMAGGAEPYARRRRQRSSPPSAASRYSPWRRSKWAAGRPLETYLARGLDDSFLANTTFGLGDVAQGYGSEAEVWAALRNQPGLAVVDSTIVPRRDNWAFGVLPDFRLSGLLLRGRRLSSHTDRGRRRADREHAFV